MIVDIDGKSWYKVTYLHTVTAMDTGEIVDECVEYVSASSMPNAYIKVRGKCDLYGPQVLKIERVF